VTETITLQDACRRTHAADHLAISHRWDERDLPDPSGAQLDAIRAHLDQHPHITRVWIDYCCMPQSLSSDAEDFDARTESERQQFRLQLKNVNLLYLGVGVLVLTDRSYLSRFWRACVQTNFEAWLSMQDVSIHGLISARHASWRCTIKCVHGAPEGLIESLVEEWSDCTARKAFEKLSSADVMCTNLSDKEVQLPKILELDQRVADVALAIGLEREPSPDIRAVGQTWDEASEPLVERSQTF